jgi:glyoxylase I family protein
MLKKVDHIAICVKDVNVMADFFRKLGFEEVRRTDHHGGAVEVRLPGEDQILFEFTTLRSSENPGVNHIAFLVEDCQEAAEELKSQGVALDSEPHKVESSGRFIASFRDPYGFRLQITE